MWLYLMALFLTGWYGMEIVEKQRLKALAMEKENERNNNARLGDKARPKTG